MSNKMSSNANNNLDSMEKQGEQGEYESCQEANE
jgi:hypothetical protein